MYTYLGCLNKTRGNLMHLVNNLLEQYVFIQQHNLEKMYGLKYFSIFMMHNLKKAIQFFLLRIPIKLDKKNDNTIFCLEHLLHNIFHLKTCAKTWKCAKPINRLSRTYSPVCFQAYNNKNAKTQLHQEKITMHRNHVSPYTISIPWQHIMYII